MKKHIPFLLVTTLLTACGGEGGEAERKARQGITDDGEKGEHPTIVGEHPTMVEDGSGTIEPSVTEEPQNKAKSIKDNFDKLLRLVHSPNPLTEKEIGDRATEVVKLAPELLRNAFDVYDIYTPVYNKAIEQYKNFDAKGDFSAGGWDKLVALNRNVKYYESLLEFTPNKNIRNGTLEGLDAARIFSGELFSGLYWSDNALSADGVFREALNKIIEHSNSNINISPGLIERIVALSQKQLPAQLNQIVSAKKSKFTSFHSKYNELLDLTRMEIGDYENLLQLKHVIEGAVYTKRNKILMGGKEYSENLTHHGMSLLNEISESMYKKGFIRDGELYKDEDEKIQLTSLTLTSLGAKPLIPLARIINPLTRVIVSAVEGEMGGYFDNFIFTGKTFKEITKTSVSGGTDPEELSDEKFFSFFNNELFNVVFKPESHSFVVKGSSFLGIGLNKEQSTKLSRAMYKAFVSALIPRTEFKGLFDFLKEEEGFKDDAEFMDLFKVSAAALSAGMILDISSDPTFRSARVASTGLVDLRRFHMNSTSGQATQLGIPLFVQLKGGVASTKSTEAAAGSVAYRLGNTVIGAIQGYGNSGAGFGLEGRQLESSVVASHSFGGLFIEGQIGSVSADDVHSSNWGGYRTQLTLGFDTSFVTPFVQVSHRQLDRDGIHKLNETVGYVGLDMDIANLTTDTYSLNTRLLTKVGYGEQNWSKGSRDIGTTAGVRGSVEWTAGVNLNSGISFSTNLSVDTLSGSSAGFKVGLDR